MSRVLSMEEVAEVVERKLGLRDPANYRRLFVDRARQFGVDPARAFVRAAKELHVGDDWRDAFHRLCDMERAGELEDMKEDVG